MIFFQEPWKDYSALTAGTFFKLNMLPDEEKWRQNEIRKEGKLK